MFPAARAQPQPPNPHVGRNPPEQEKDSVLTRIRNVVLLLLASLLTFVILPWQFAAGIASLATLAGLIYAIWPCCNCSEVVERINAPPAPHNPGNVQIFHFDQPPPGQRAPSPAHRHVRHARPLEQHEPVDRQPIFPGVATQFFGGVPTPTPHQAHQSARRTHRFEEHEPVDEQHAWPPAQRPPAPIAAQFLDTPTPTPIPGTLRRTDSVGSQLFSQLIPTMQREPRDQPNLSSGPVPTAQRPIGPSMHVRPLAERESFNRPTATAAPTPVASTRLEREPIA